MSYNMQELTPRWAVRVVKLCVAVLTLWPLGVLVWAIAYRPTPVSDLGPYAFGISLGLLLIFGMLATALTSIYPPLARH